MKRKITVSYSQLIFFALLSMIFVYNSSYASSQITQTSQQDFLTGTLDSNLDANASPGELKLKQQQTLTETTKDEFSVGTVDSDSSKKSYISNDDGGEIRISRANYRYSTDTTPALPSTNLVHVSLDSAHDLLYVSGQDNGGLSVFDTNGTADTSDDTLLITYSTLSTPAIPSNDVSYSYIDPTNNLLYIGIWDVGLTVIDTKGTVDPSDDVLLYTYNTTSSAPIASNSVENIYIDHEHNLLYVVAFGGGLSVINTQGTVSDADDTTVKNFTASSTPAIGSNRIHHIYPDSNGYLYISTDGLVGGGGLTVLDTHGSGDPNDFTLVANYSTSTTPSLPDNNVYQSFLDHVHNVLYVSSNKGLTAINTKGTESVDDDVILKTYNNLSPNLTSNAYSSAYLDASRNLLYISHGYFGGGMSVINTHGTLDISDDTVEATYSTNSESKITGYGIVNSALDTSRNILYILSNGQSEDGVGGVFIIDNDHPEYNSEGVYNGRPFSLADTPKNMISWEQVKNSNQNVSIQTRTGDQDAYWTDNFNDGDASNVSDYYGYGMGFNDVNENNGVLEMSNPVSEWGAYMYLDTAKLSDFFPAGSMITAKMRYVGSSDGAISANLASDDYESYSDSVNLRNGEWNYLTFHPSDSFSIVELDFNLPSDTPPPPFKQSQQGDRLQKMKLSSLLKNPKSLIPWNNDTDKIEIDWVSIEMPDGEHWSSWSSACSNNESCTIGNTDGKSYLQYRLNLSTGDASATPKVNSVTLGSGYPASGEYVSGILDAGSSSQWESISSDSNLPSGTSITFYTRTGNSSSVNPSWSDWALADSSIVSPEGRYIQYKAVLLSTNIAKTPTLSDVTITYSPAHDNNGNGNGNGHDNAVTYNLPIASVGNHRSYQTSVDTTTYVNGQWITFRGRMNDLKRGRVQILKGGKVIGRGKIHTKGKWRIRIHCRKNINNIFQVRYIDSRGQQTELTPSFQIVVR